MDQFVIIEAQVYLVNSEEEIQIARKALVGKQEFARIWFGDPDDPSAYVSETLKLFPESA